MKKILMLALVSLFLGFGNIQASTYEPDETTTTRTKTSRSKSKSKSGRTSTKSSSTAGKRWNGATSIADFKSKIIGTTWGSTQKRGDFYWKFEIKGDKLYITSYLRSDFNPASKIGGTLVDDIEQWREKDGKVFAIVASAPGEDKNSWTYVPIILGFQKNGPGATWSTIDGTIPLKQIL